MKKISRRKFMCGGAAAVGVPLLLPGRVWGAETNPNDRITMGFVGMGIQSRGLLRRFLGDKGVEVLAVCDVDGTRLVDAGATVDAHYAGVSEGAPGKCAVYSDFRELIARDDIDAVCIATPDHWHAYITVAALGSGKDVYCEKPLTHNIDESIAVMKAVKRNGRVLQTGSMQRSSQEFRIACELVRSGAIGKIDHVLCSFGPPGKPCDLPEEAMEPGLDWERWIGPGPMRPYSSVLSPRGLHKHFPHWRNYKEYGGGMVCDWGAHHLDIAQWGLGMDAKGPVMATPPEDPAATEGAVLTYGNEIEVIHKPGAIGITFVGEDGVIGVDRGQFSMTLDDKEIANYTRATEETRERGASLGGALRTVDEMFPAEERVQLYKSKNHVGDFLACMKSRTRPITNEEVGGRTAICCHLMNQAYYNHAEIKWKPKKIRFKRGSGEASWLTRDCRGPWSV